MIDRKAFFDSIRASLFNGVLSQRQVDGMNYLLDVWERVFNHEDIRWLAYALATVFHETAYTPWSRSKNTAGGRASLTAEDHGAAPPSLFRSWPRPADLGRKLRQG